MLFSTTCKIPMPAIAPDRRKALFLAKRMLPEYVFDASKLENNPITFPDEAMETLINIFENIFETACVATLLLDSNEITVEDSRYLFTSVVQIAFEFEKQFNPGYGDYILKIKDYAERRLKKEFPPED